LGDKERALYRLEQAYKHPELSGLGNNLIQAEVLAMLASTGAKHKTLTNDWGNYALLSLAPGKL
jgi:hypothetical protein